MENTSQKAISIHRNVVANYIGTFCQVLLGFLFVPLYIKYLGIESYGLIGFSVSLSALLRLTDLGLSSTLNREFARYSALPESAQRMRDLLKTLQIVYWSISLLLGLVTVLCAPLIAKYWIHSGSLDVTVIQNAVILMGLTSALQGPMSLYIGGIFGLQRHVLGNIINTIWAVLRFGGVVLVLELFSPTITVFFSFQFCVALLGSLCTGFMLWSILPRNHIPSRFQISQLKSVWRFAAGMSINSVLWLILSQMDKIILIKILPLRLFGYYALASTAASAITYLGGPLFTTFLPRYTQLYAVGDEEHLRETYRTSCLLNAIITIPTFILLAIFSKEVLLVWTGNPDVVDHAYLLLSLLVIAHGLNQLTLLSFALQIATGWIKLSVYMNTVAIILVVPSFIIATRLYGSLGAAAVWIALSCYYVFISVNVLHRRILEGEARRWYAGMLRLLVLAFGIGLTGWYFMPAVTGILFVMSVGLLWTGVIGTSILATPDLRNKVPLLMRKY